MRSEESTEGRRCRGSRPWWSSDLILSVEGVPCRASSRRALGSDLCFKKVAVAARWERGCWGENGSMETREEGPRSPEGAGWGRGGHESGHSHRELWEERNVHPEKEETLVDTSADLHCGKAVSGT